VTGDAEQESACEAAARSVVKREVSARPFILKTFPSFL